MGIETTLTIYDVWLVDAAASIMVMLPMAMMMMMTLMIAIMRRMSGE